LLVADHLYTVCPSSEEKRQLDIPFTVVIFQEHNFVFTDHESGGVRKAILDVVHGTVVMAIRTAMDMDTHDPFSTPELLALHIGRCNSKVGGGVEGNSSYAAARSRSRREGAGGYV
jgi:hypothetical protein